MHSQLNLVSILQPWEAARENLLFAISQYPGRDVVLWGAGRNGRLTGLLLHDIGIKPTAVYDACPDGNLNGIPMQKEPKQLSSQILVLIAMNGPPDAVKSIIAKCLEAGAPCIQVVNFTSEKKREIVASPCSLADYIGRHAGQRCFVAGNGPSLNKIDMGKLKNEVVIGSNRCYLGFKKWGFRFPYWSVEDRDVSGWQATEWRKLRGVQKFVPRDMADLCENDDDDICFFDLERIDFVTRPPLFSIYSELLFAGRTVTYLLLQLAAIMGCNPIYLIGVDFHFDKTGTTEEQQGSIWRQHAEDKNHFDSNYIPKGRFMTKPHWDLQKLAFQSARHASKLYGFEIFNATPNSRLHVFEHVRFNDLF